MNTATSQNPTNARDRARNSYTGQRLTDSEFETAWNITGIIRRELEKSGSFIEPLTDYARTFAGRNAVDASKQEMILRDMYAARYGETLNKTREALLERDARVREVGQDRALHHARTIEGMIKDGPTMPFYQALDKAAIAMARKHQITESGAKSMMKESFEAAEGKPLYDHGKDVEARYHAPVRKAERATRQAERGSQRSRTQNRVPQ